MFLVGDGCGFHGLALSSPDLNGILKRRFQIYNDYKTHLVAAADDLGPFFKFKHGVTRFYMSDCLLAYSKDTTSRIKHISGLGVFSRRLSMESIKKFLKSSVFRNDGNVLHIHGIQSYPESVDKVAASAQLQSLFLNRVVHETEIGWFLSERKDIICSVFDVIDMSPETTLHLQTSSEKEISIRPDAFLFRRDGFCDILDLKLAASGKKRLTKGARARRRFVDYVEEGIAQLAHYEDYFSYPENAEYAFSKYRIRVNKPRLILIVGNEENTSSSEVQEAMRRYSNSRISVIDYDTLARSFLMGESI